MHVSIYLFKSQIICFGVLHWKGEKELLTCRFGEVKMRRRGTESADKICH